MGLCYCLFKVFQWLPIAFRHNPAPFPVGIVHPVPFPQPLSALLLQVLTWSTWLQSASSVPAFLRFLKRGWFVLSLFCHPECHSPNFYMIGSLTWVSREPLSGQLSRTAPPFPAPQSLLIPLTLFFSRHFNTIWKYIVYLMAGLEASVLLPADSTC